MDNVQVDGPFFIEDRDGGTTTLGRRLRCDRGERLLTSNYEFYPFAQLYVLEVIEPDG
jgi:hypothetical protein